MPFYDELWIRSESTSRAYRPQPQSSVLLWVSPGGERNCLIPCGAEVPERNEQVVRALRISTKLLNLEGYSVSRYLVLTCIDQSAFRLFDQFVHDLDCVSSILTELDSKLEEYRHFWERPYQQFTAEDAIGLFGEVWFLDRWLSVDIEHGFNAWTGQRQLLHDFTWSEATVEVKATQGGLPPTHKITSLEQLEAQDGKVLFLFSLAVRQDNVAGNLLSDLLSSYRAKLSSVDLANRFDRQIAGRGYRPDNPDNDKFRYILLDGGEQLYAVSGSFPRLLRRSFVGGTTPSGVGKVSYEITMAGFDECLSGLQPGFDACGTFGDPVSAPD